MADAYVIDTNLYVRASRDVVMRRALQQFSSRAGARLLFHGVVAMELRAGTRTVAQREALADIVVPFTKRNNMLVPLFSAYEQAGRVLADLVEHEGVVLATAPRSLRADALIAASCREHRVTLVTENVGDFTAIERHLRGFHFTPPWPPR